MSTSSRTIKLARERLCLAALAYLLQGETWIGAQKRWSNWKSFFLSSAKIHVRSR